MSKDMDYTMKFEGLSSDKMNIEETIFFVYDAMSEKGYNPINQIIGYLLSGDSSYITSHKNARNIIKRFERDEILEEIITKYINK